MLLKRYKKIISIPPAHLTNLSFSSGAFPGIFKVAKSIPQLKDGDISAVSNYRPISILSVFSKNLERVMYKRLPSFLFSTNTAEGKPLMTSHQYGFQSTFSISHALTETSLNLCLLIWIKDCVHLAYF